MQDETLRVGGAALQHTLPAGEAVLLVAGMVRALGLREKLLLELAQAAPQGFLQAVHALMAAGFQQALRTRRPMRIADAAALMQRGRMTSIVPDIHA